jgi:hypothetical protein
MESRPMRGVMVGLVLAAALLPAPAPAQLYQWVDDQGTIHYATGLERVPERYRPEARRVPVPRGPDGGGGDVRPAPPSVATFAFTPGAPIVVEARINGVGPVRLVLDTGADRTLVAPAALQRLAIPLPDAPTARIHGVTGASLAGEVWVDSVAVGPFAVGPLPIVAHDAALAGADGLLGRDFLSLFTVTIDTSAGVVTLRRQ